MSGDEVPAVTPPPATEDKEKADKGTPAWIELVKAGDKFELKRK